MYVLLEREDVIRIPPEKLSENFEKVIEEVTRETFEGRLANGILNLLITDVEGVEECKIVHGDPGVYQKVKFTTLAFKPELQEIVEGFICEILEFGAFVRLGSLDGLVHISQVMDDRISYDAGNQRLVGKQSKRDLKVGDKVRARIVTLSFNERVPRDSKIGLTMRQPGVGKFEWLEEAEKEVEKKEKK
ncbi:MAG: DNA-directed RNA polymerase [Candidatus Thermoplasmatota archaeon]|nr:DNA-directed RNA polymerase [Candidatus Thermoplasmatota archaeon]